MKRILCLAAAMLFLLCGCSGQGEPNGNQTTAERFTSAAEKLNMEVRDRQEDTTGNYEAYLTAYSSNMSAEFMIVSDEATAVEIYEDQKTNINQFYTEGDERKESRGKTYSKFILTTQDNYYVLTRVERSVLLVSGTLDSQETCDELETRIGY